MQTLDLFSRLESPQIAHADPQDGELDEAVETLALTWLPFIIHPLIHNDAANLLRRLRANPVLDKGDVTGSSSHWHNPLSELLRHKLVFYESRKPICMGINRKRVLAMATETDKRIGAWEASEFGVEKGAAQ